MKIGVAFVFILLCGCTMPWLDHRTNGQLQTELEDLSTKGLALARPAGSALHLRFFDGSQSELPMVCCPEHPVLRIAGGNRVTMLAGKEFMGDPDLSKVGHFVEYMFARSSTVVLVDLTTDKVLGRSRFQVKATEVSASPSGRFFAFVGSPQGLWHAAEGVYVAGFSDDQGRRLVELHHSDADLRDPSNKADLDWAPDEKSILLSHGGDIQEVDVATGQVRFLMNGGHARWAPRGDRISFLSPQREAAILTVKTGEIVILDPGRRSNRSVDWSPDGNYVLVTETDGSHVPFGCLWICRVADQAWTPIMNYGVAGPAPQWIQTAPALKAAVERTRFVR